MKAFVYPEQALVVWASRKLARPVKWQAERSEGFVSDNQGRDHITRAELALERRAIPRPARLDPRQSRRLSLAVRRLRAARSTDLVSGLYGRRDPRQRQRRLHQHRAGLRLSRRRAAGGRLSGRAPGRCAARELGMSPDDIRRINFVPPSAMPFTSATKLVFDSGEFESVMDQCMAAAEWSSFATAATRASGRRCAASAWRPIPSAAAAAFPRPRRSSSRTTGRAGDGQSGIRHRPRHRLQADRIGPARHRCR